MQTKRVCLHRLPRCFSSDMTSDEMLQQVFIWVALNLLLMCVCVFVAVLRLKIPPFALIHLFCFGLLFRFKAVFRPLSRSGPRCFTCWAQKLTKPDRLCYSAPVPKHVPGPHKSHLGCAAESLSNKITLSICTLRGSDCRALRSPMPSLLLDLLLFLLRSSNPGLHDWLQLKAPHARGGSQKHCETQKRPPAHQTKLHSQKAMGSGENEKEASKMRVKRKTSHCTPSVILADKRTNYISASRHPGVRTGIGSLPALFVRKHVDIGSISSHKRAREVYCPAFQPFILASFVSRYPRVCCLSLLLGRIDCYYSKQHYLY